MADVPRLKTCVKLPDDLEELSELIEKAKDWSLMHGAGIRSKTNFSPDALQFVPFSLLPSVFPRKEFERAVSIQPILNELVHKVAFCHTFLKESLKDTIEVDEFTGRLYKIYETVREEGFNPDYSFGVLRSDYMADEPDDNRIKQVEINTVSTSLSAMGTVTVGIQSFVLKELGYSDKVKYLPENDALNGVCLGLIEAWKLFGDKDAVILVVVEHVTYNVCDQRFHEFRIGELCPEARCIRRTMTDIKRRGRLADGKDRALVIDGMTVAVAYYRTGYTPDLYPSEEEWDARLMVERSSAIKCPSIHYHLAGTKKVQQALANPQVLEKFISDPEKVKSVRNLFTGLYCFDFDESGEKTVQMALENPERYVLKPQREGGGHNVYGENIRDTVAAMRNSKERTGWILMDRIVPPVQENVIIRPGHAPVKQDLVSELGIFGIIIGDSEKIVYNKQVGHMLRSKASTSNEGGVAAGAGCMDSPYLCEHC